MTEKETEAYHYPKNSKGQKTGHTICILVVDGRLFVGEALCSSEDVFSKKVGRKIAKGRALKSVERYLKRKQQDSVLC